MYPVLPRLHKLSNDVSVDEPLEDVDLSLWRCTVSALSLVHPSVGIIFHARDGEIVDRGSPVSRTS